MDKATDPSIFVNDGSFMERFKQLQQEKDKKSEVLEKSRSGSSTSASSIPKTVISKTTLEIKANDSHKTFQSPLSRKLVFSLKQKSKLAAAPVKFDEDDDERNGGNSSDDGPKKRPKLSEAGASDQSLQQVDLIPKDLGGKRCKPKTLENLAHLLQVRKVADKLASFVAKNGRQFEHVTRQKNPGDTPFMFLFDEKCSDYKYYLYRLSEEQKASTQSRDFQASQSGESSAPTGSDPVAMMEFYMKKAAQEEKLRPPKPSKDEMPPPASLQAPMKKGHHMGDYIPVEELEKFLASCNDAYAQKAMKEHVDKAKIQADNVGHRLLSKMGWKEGEGLGSSKSGISTPIMAGDVKKDHLGVGAHAPGEVTADDDIYDQYKKRMMLGYRHRPNPMNNPRKAYY